MRRIYRRRQTYDHRIRDAIAATGNPHLFDSVPIPLSTRRTWTQAKFQPTVTTNEIEIATHELLDQVQCLQTRVKSQASIIALLMRVLSFRGGKLTLNRLPDGRHKSALLRTLGVATRSLGVDSALRIVGLSRSRYHAWRRRDVGCGLTDESSCPKSFPTRLTRDEVATMRDFVEASDYRHIAIQNLAIHAQRLGKVFACAGTWYKTIKQRRWRRPRKRIHPNNPRLGLRAEKPNQYWHTDATVIRLTSGARIYLQAIIDNFSRKILSWRVTDALTSVTTHDLIVEAARGLRDGTVSDVSLVVDNGRENYGTVNELLDEPMRLTRILAQVDIVFSNSMIEAWWRELKHTFLFTHVLDSTAVVAATVGYYVEQHNAVVGRAILGGRTPDEVYHGRAIELPRHLAEHAEAARKARVEWNRSRSCNRCTADKEPVSIQSHRTNDGMLHKVR